MILYPTETVYALGVNVFDTNALGKLYELKGREIGKLSSWLVRDINDIKSYAVMSKVAVKIAEQFLPGPLTLVLPLREPYLHLDGSKVEMIGFRVTPDSVGSELIISYMAEYDAPLTCTSANISGQPTQATVQSICEQFSDKVGLIEKIIDDGPRSGITSTVVRVIGDQIEIIREGAIRKEEFNF